MIKRIKKLSITTVGILAGLLISITSVDTMASQVIDNNDVIVTTVDGSLISNFPITESEADNKCGEGKCGAASKEKSKKGEKKEVTEKKEGNETTEKKCGEGKCGGAEKKEGKAEKEGAKKEAKEGKCGEGKCGVA